MRLDVIALIEGRRVAVELKYLLRDLKTTVEDELFELPFQRAQDVRRDDFVKDIARLELPLARASSRTPPSGTSASASAQHRENNARRWLARQHPALDRAIDKPAMRADQKPATEPGPQPRGRSGREGGRIMNLFGDELDSSQAAYEAWLDEHDARVPLTRNDLHSPADHAAERAVAAG